MGTRLSASVAEVDTLAMMYNSGDVTVKASEVQKETQLRKHPAQGRHEPPAVDRQRSKTRTSMEPLCLRPRQPSRRLISG